MNTKYTEEEDKFISWFRENYKNILIGILFGITIITSYKFYTDSKVNSMHDISLKYVLDVRLLHKLMHVHLLTFLIYPLITKDF